MSAGDYQGGLGCGQRTAQGLQQGHGGMYNPLTRLLQYHQAGASCADFSEDIAAHVISDVCLHKVQLQLDESRIESRSLTFAGWQGRGSGTDRGAAGSQEEAGEEAGIPECQDHRSEAS